MRIRVYVFKRNGRKNFEAQWVDPITGLKKTRTTQTAKRREAERFAARLEAELIDGQSKGPSRITWKDFRERYEDEVLADMELASRKKIRVTLNHVEKHIRPARLASIDEEQISKFKRFLSKKVKQAQPTVKGNMVNLRAALKWAVKMGLLKSVPHMVFPKKPKGSKLMKGRPITSEEFERMLKKVPNVVKLDVPEDEREKHEEKYVELQRVCIDSYRDLMEGLWWSGLRLNEALDLHWVDDRNLCVDFSGKRPTFRIRAHADKGRKERHLPMAPEFAQWLDKVSRKIRKGYVFNPMPVREPFHVRLGTGWVSRRIVDIGDSAKVKVGERMSRRDKSATETDGFGEIIPKFASAHDLRRAFGFRWAMRVMPKVLMEMMRHESIDTTMKYYVGQNAQATADAAWAAFANIPTNTSKIQTSVSHVEDQ